jgi:hypothetical protein
MFPAPLSARREVVMRPIRRVSALVAMLAVTGACLHAQAAPPTGRVTVTFTVNRSMKIASDQLAVWIEDEKGAFVRTLFVTDFTGRRSGWKARAQTVPTWVIASDAKNTARSEIDAVSGATPKNGSLSVVWDLKDRKGTTVPPGNYRYRIEGNISWENRVLWTGTVRVGAARDSTGATAVYSPPGAEKLGSFITEVSAVFEPGK